MTKKNVAKKVEIFHLNDSKQIIGGHGSWVKGGVYTLGVSKKNFRPPSAAKKFLRRLWHRGVK